MKYWLCVLRFLFMLRFRVRLAWAWHCDKRTIKWLIDKCPPEDTGRHLTRLKWQASQCTDPGLRDALLDLYARVEARIKRKL